MSRKGSLSAAFLGLLTLTFILPARLWSGQDLLDLVRAGNRSAIQSIRTLSCKIAIVHTPNEGRIYPEADYLRSSDAIRIRWQSGGEYLDSVRRDSKTQGVVKSRGKDGRETARYSTSRSSPGERFGDHDAWFLGLLSFPGPDGTALPLDDLLQKPHKLRKVSRETKDGRQFIIVAFSNEPLPNKVGDFEVWFDPQANYLACKLVGTSTRQSPKLSKSSREAEILRFKEAAPGIYFPEHVQARYSRDGREFTEVVKFSDIRINQPLPADSFQPPPVPAGAMVFDEIQGKAYKADARGNPVGPSAPLATFPPLPPGTVQPTETAEEPKSMARWILPGSLAVLAMAGGLWFFRKWRPSAAEVK